MARKCLLNYQLEWGKSPLFWNAGDLQNKLVDFQRYYNGKRGHSSLDHMTPAEKANEKITNVISIDHYQWKSLARGLFQLPVAA